MIPSGLRGGVVKLQHLPFSEDDAVEPSTPWLQTPPEFVAYTREGEDGAWSCPRRPSSLHATYDVTRDDVVLFGPSHLVDNSGAWNFEAQARPEQYVRFYDSDNYRHIFKGAKPTLGRDGEDGYTVSFEAVADGDVVQLEGPVFLATPIEPDNWGRWLSTVVPKVFRYVQSGRPRHPMLCRSAKTWQKRLLEFLGADLDRVIEHDPGRTYACPRVLTTTYSAADITPTASEMDVFRDIARQCCGARQRFGPRIFVSRASRSASAPKYRVLTNEAELLAKVEALGFELIEPETLSFEDQVARFASASFVVGLGGAGMFNVLFCRPGAKVITIESGPTFIGGHSRLFAAAGLRYGVVFGLPDDTDPAPIHKRWSVDTGKVIDAIRRFA